MKILLITPPLTQLNTPYPATPYLKGYLKQQGHEVMQADLGIELIDRLFSRRGLQQVFDAAATTLHKKSPVHFKQMIARKDEYLFCIEGVMRFLQGRDATLATRIADTSFLPQGRRFAQMADIDWAFGAIGITERARHMATLFIEDLTDLIQHFITPHFGLSRYAESLCMRMPDFEPLHHIMQQPGNLIDTMLVELLEAKLASFSPQLVGFSIPFPGNLLGALQCGKHIRQNHPHIKIAWGGGYANTELRQLSDAKVFDYTDYVLLDDGEPSLKALVSHLEKNTPKQSLHQTFYKDANGNVTFATGDRDNHIAFDSIPTPDYSDLPLHLYISTIELTNPMHKLWSDGRWNKLTLAHGCYWAKCAFCDTSLPYIGCYDPASATTLCDHIESIMAQTGISGFHFTDEAAPPKLLRELSNEIIRRGLVISWWTNIRFEKSYTPELCALMSKAGCIAVAGGIEVASNRLLKVINKGVTIEQAATTAHHLTTHDIMVHAYLMYGFPTQSVHETIDGLEMVRQMFDAGILQSAFWHRYAMTLHSPSGIEPEKFGATRIPEPTASFANNEIAFTDHQHIDLDMLGEGLRKATYNYMHGLGLEMPLREWFAGKTPSTKIKPNWIDSIVQS